MNYFNHHYASNSDLKKIISRHEGQVEPEGLQKIFDFGTEFHAGILEPHKADLSRLEPQKQDLVKAMSRRFWKDNLCREIALRYDFRREHEFYRSNRFGLKGVRCKCDGESKSLRVILELKGLSVTSEKQFRESVEHLGYDQGAAWYLNTTMGHVKYDYKLIVGISKIDPDQMFKLLVKWDDPMYRNGMQKIKKGVGIWKMYGLE